MKKSKIKLISFSLFIFLFLMSYVLVFIITNQRIPIDTPNFIIHENVLKIDNVSKATHYEIFKATSFEIEGESVVGDFYYYTTTEASTEELTYFEVNNPSHGVFFKLRAITKVSRYLPSDFADPAMMKIEFNYLTIPRLIRSDSYPNRVNIVSDNINVLFFEVLVEKGGIESLRKEISISNPYLEIDPNVPQILSARAISNTPLVMDSLYSEEIIIGNIRRIETPQFNRVDGQLFVDSVSHASSIEVVIVIPNRLFQRIDLDPTVEHVINLERVRSQTVILRAISNHPTYVSSPPVSVEVNAFAVVYLFDFGILYLDNERVLSEEIRLYFEGSTTSVAVFNPGLRIDFLGFNDDYTAEYHYIEDIREDHVVIINTAIIQLDLPIISLGNELGTDIQMYDWVNSTLIIIDDYGTVSDYLVQMMEYNMNWHQAPIPKSPYRFRFPLGEETSVLGFAAARDFVLLANAADNSHLRAYLGHSISRAIAPPERFEATVKHVDLFLNGEFKGIYTLTEKMQYHENRVNIDLENGDWYLRMYGGARDNGAIYGLDYIIGPFGRNTQFIDLTLTPDYANRNSQQINELNDLLNNFNNSIIRRDNSFYQYIDIESFIDYFLVQELMMQMDIGWSSVHFTVEDGIIRMGPAWGLEFTSLNTSWNWQSYIQLGPYVYQTLFVYEHHGWFRYLMRNSDFVEALYHRWVEVYETVLQDIFSIENEEYLINFLLPSIHYENLRWADYWENTWIGHYHHWSVTEGRFIYNSDFETYVSNLFEFFRMRSTFLTEHYRSINTVNNTVSIVPMIITIAVIVFGIPLIIKAKKKKNSDY